MSHLQEIYRAELKAAGGDCRPIGPMDVYRFGSGEQLVLFFCDAGGVRPSMFAMAARLAASGREVWIPDVYHRAGDYPPFDPATVFSDSAEMARLQSIAGRLSKAQAIEDTAACLAASPARAVACVGYCMGGGLALSAAGSHRRITATAAFHAAHLATDAPDSPHLLATQLQGRVYLGVAGIDPYFSEAELRRLEQALASAPAQVEIDIYTGAHHGFAVPDNPTFDPEASERHWRALLALLDARA